MIKNIHFIFACIQRVFLAWIVFILCITSSFAQKDLNLLKSICIAKEESQLLKVQKYNVDIYKTYILTSKLRPNPIFNNQNLFLLNHDNVTPSSYVPVSSSNNILDSKNNQLWFQLTKPMQFGDLRNKKISLAEDEYEKSKLNYEVSVSEVCYDVANKWIELWAINKKLEVYEAVKNVNDSILYFNVIKLKNNFITTIDYERIKLLSDISNRKKAILQLEFTNSLATFRQKLRIDGSINIANENNIEIYVLPQSLDSLLILGMLYRTDLRVAQSNSKYYKKNIGLQKALSYPYIEAGFIFNPQNSIYYAGTYVTSSLPIFNRNQGGIQKSISLYNQSESYIEGNENKARSEITIAYNSYIAKKESIPKFGDMTNKSTDIFNVIKHAYLRGNTTILDLLEAEKSYLQLHLLFIDNEYNYRKAYIDLLFYTGLLNKI